MVAYDIHLPIHSQLNLRNSLLLILSVVHGPF